MERNEVSFEVAKDDGEQLFLSEPFIGIKRHRLLTDGKGVTSLVAFHGCPMSCKYCINPQCKADEGIWQYLTPLQLYNRLKVDDIYFQTTGGGVVFGGGEPLLYPEFIKQFSDISKDNHWNIYLETSLNVKAEALEELLPIVKEFIVDVKDMNPAIYQSYSGLDNFNVIENLKFIVKHGAADKVLVRVPSISGYNTKEDVERSVFELQKMGLKRFERFEYLINPKGGGTKNDDLLIGKAICDVLKRIRLMVAEANEIEYCPDECTQKSNCPGTCPKCETELRLLTEELNNRKSKGISVKI